MQCQYVERKNASRCPHERKQNRQVEHSTKIRPPRSVKRQPPTRSFKPVDEIRFSKIQVCIGGQGSIGRIAIRMAVCGTAARHTMNYVYELRRVLSSHRKGTKACTGTARANEMQTGEKLISDDGFPCFRCGRFSHATLLWWWWWWW